MASAPSVLVKSVRRKSAAERRAQQLRSDARCLQKLLGGLLDVQGHRGNQLSKVGKSLLGVIQRSAPEPTHSPPAEVLKKGMRRLSPGPARTQMWPKLTSSWTVWFAVVVGLLNLSQVRRRCLRVQALHCPHCLHWYLKRRCVPAKIAKLLQKIWNI